MWKIQLRGHNATWPKMTFLLKDKDTKLSEMAKMAIDICLASNQKEYRELAIFIEELLGGLSPSLIEYKFSDYYDNLSNRIANISCGINGRYLYLEEIYPLTDKDLSNG